MGRPSRIAALLVLLLAAIGCGSSSRTGQGGAASPAPSTGGVDPDAVRAADFSILFVGNSHTGSHNLPDLVGRMIQFQKPGASIHVSTFGVGHLEDLVRSSHGKDKLESAPWKFVVLQAQKISMSGKFEYSRKDGIEFAKLAKSRGAAVYFYSEWGLRGVPRDGQRNERIYSEMARDSGASVIPVGRAWDLALARKTDLPLYEDDGNHQTTLGAFLTACVISGRLTGVSPAGLAAFAYPEGTEDERKLLSDAAARALAEFDTGRPK